MPANSILSNSKTVDTTAVSIMAVIGGSAGLHRVCEQIRLQDGTSPSYALCKIPLAALDSVAPSCACIEEGPRKSIKHGTPAYVAARVGDTSLVLLSGIVTSVADQWSANEDCLVVKIEDERERMRKWPIIGSFWASGAEDADSGVAYRQGWNFHVNPGGAPNCIFRKAAGWADMVPVMCNPWHGISANADPPLPSAGDYMMACYWTPRTILDYLRFCFSAGGRTIAILAGFKAYPVVPESIDWPAGLGESLTVRGVPAELGRERKAADHSYERSTLIGAVQHAIEQSGPYSVNMTYGASPSDVGSVQSSLHIIRTRYDSGGISLSRPTSGNASEELKGINVILSGSLNESSQNLYTKYCAAGDLVFIERRVRMLYDADEDDGDLKRAWDLTTETAFKTLVQTVYNGGSTLATAIQKGIAQYPSVGAAYKLKHTFNFQADTSEVAYGLADVGRPILQTLLTSYLENQSGKAVSDQTRRYRKPIRFEYQSKVANPDTGTWLLCPANDGLTLDADGTIWVQGLQPGYTLAITASGTRPNATVTVSANKLRASVAIPCDHRLWAARKLASETGDMTTAQTPGRDASRMASDLDFMLYEGQGDGDYAIEERYESWPIPESVAGSTKQTGMLRDDSLLIENHAERRSADFGRIERSGELILRNPMTPLRPGTAIESMDGEGGSYPLGVVVRSVDIHNANQNGSGAVGTPAQVVSIEVV